MENATADADLPALVFSKVVTSDVHGWIVVRSVAMADDDVVMPAVV